MATTISAQVTFGGVDVRQGRPFGCVYCLTMFHMGINFTWFHTTTLFLTSWRSCKPISCDIKFTDSKDPCSSCLQVMGRVNLGFMSVKNQTLKWKKIEKYVGDLLYYVALRIANYCHTPLPCLTKRSGRTCLAILLIMAKGGTWVLEQPHSSLVFRHPRFQMILRYVKEPWHL